MSNDGRRRTMAQMLAEMSEPVCQCYHSNYIGPSADDRSSACTPGYVYIVAYGLRYKIGCSRNKRGLPAVGWRVRVINLAMRETGRLVYVIGSACALGLEKYLHAHFSDAYYGSGELYFLMKPDLLWLDSLGAFNGAAVEFIDPSRVHTDAPGAAIEG